jgi:hypothetical protein
LHPLLSALEGLVYPSSTSIQSNNAAASGGNIEIIAATAPLTVFVFGPKRIAPVRITELSITEEAFDVELNPIRAKISLGLRVLTIDDIAFEERGGGLFMSYLKAKEQLASQSKSGAFAALGIGGLP